MTVSSDEDDISLEAGETSRTADYCRARGRFVHARRDGPSGRFVEIAARAPLGLWTRSVLHGLARANAPTLARK